MSNSLLAEPAVETSALVKQFGDFVAVDNINLRVNRGSFFGFLGPNGAGKSTTIKMLTGLLGPTSGTLRVLNFDVAKQPMEVKRRIGVVPEDLNLFERLTGAEMLSFTGRMYGLRREEIAQRSKELLDLMDLQDEPRKLIIEYSHGMKKKLSLACRADSSTGDTFSRRTVRRYRRDRLTHAERSAVAIDCTRADSISHVSRAGDSRAALQRHRNHRAGQVACFRIAERVAKRNPPRR